MNDLELLMAAAKAAGLKVILPAAHQRGLWIEGLEDEWNPLEDDGDALRLAVKLGMNVYTDHGRSMAEVLCNAERDYESASENHDNDANAATRRAIVRVAAYQEKNNGN